MRPRVRLVYMMLAVLLASATAWAGEKMKRRTKWRKQWLIALLIRGTAPVGERVGQFCSYHYHPPWVLVLPFTLCP